jgi:hypothetical protein
VLQLAKEARYPVNSGHNALRGEPTGNHTERALTEAQVATIGRLHGVIGVGSSDRNSEEWLDQYQEVEFYATGAGLGFGTDTNGLEKGMPPRLLRSIEGPDCVGFSQCVNQCLDGPDSECLSGDTEGGRRGCANRCANYCRLEHVCESIPDPGLQYTDSFPPSSEGTRTWNINTDGVAHYGMLWDFVEDLKLLPEGRDVVDESLMRGANSLYHTWRIAEGEQLVCEPGYTTCGRECRAVSVPILSGGGQCHSDCDCGGASEYYCALGPSQCVPTTAIQPRSGSVQETIRFTGGSFFRIPNSATQVTVLSLHDVAFRFAFDYTYASGPSTMAMDVRFLLDDTEIGRTRATNASQFVEFVAKQIGSGTLTIEARSVLVNGPPTAVKFNADWSSLSATVLRDTL